MRKDYLLRAKAGLHSLIGQIGKAREVFHIEESTMTEWMSMIKREIGLINGEIESEAKRYADLP